MKTRSSLVLSALLGFAVPAPAQESAPASRPDADLRAAHREWRAKWKDFTDASMKARQEGRLTKGGMLPDDVTAVRKTADDARDALLAKFGRRDDLSAESFRLLAGIHEAGSDYRSAVTSYEKSLAAGDAEDTGVLNSLCIAAMNSKDDKVAAKWMKTLIDIEDRRADGDGSAARRQIHVRTSYYPRTLISLEDWGTLAKLVDALAADSASACRTAAKTFRVVVKLHEGDVAGAEKLVEEIRGDPKTYPDHQAWAVLAQLSLLAHRGKFDEGARVVREFLETPESPNASAVDKNQRKDLAAVAPFLGKPAPRLRVDTWVGGEVAGPDALAALHGKVAILDFFQSWCEPCRNAMPKLVAVQKTHAADVQVLGVCKVENYGYDVSEKKAVRPLTKETFPAHIADFRADMALNYPLAIADTGENSTAYHIAGIPTLVLIDRAGIVRYMSCGAGEPGLFEVALEGVLKAK